MATVKNENIKECICDNCNSDIIYNSEFDVISYKKKYKDYAGLDVLPDNLYKKYKKQILEKWNIICDLSQCNKKITKNDVALVCDEWYNIYIIECPKCHNLIHHKEVIKRKYFIKIFAIDDNGESLFIEIPYENNIS